MTPASTPESNPQETAIGGYFRFGETLSALALAGMAAIEFGLYLLNRT